MKHEDRIAKLKEKMFACRKGLKERCGPITLADMIIFYKDIHGRCDWGISAIVRHWDLYTNELDHQDESDLKYIYTDILELGEK
jgi:hypothetical protein